MQVATINGMRTHYAVTGDREGAPLVFANSLGTDFRIWDRVLALLPPGLRVLRYDMRGHGLTDAPGGDYFMGDLVADAAALMEATGFSNAAFVGLSIGGVVAQGARGGATRPREDRGAVEYSGEDRHREELARPHRRRCAPRGSRRSPTR